MGVLPGMEVPPVETWDGGTPPLSSRPGKGVSPCWEGWGYSPSGRIGVPPSGRMGIPPPRKCGQTNTCENSTFTHPSDAGGNKDLSLQESFHCETAWCYYDESHNEVVDVTLQRLHGVISA